MNPLRMVHRILLLLLVLVVELPGLLRWSLRRVLSRYVLYVAVL
jgi:hypothetical protein